MKYLFNLVLIMTIVLNVQSVYSATLCIDEIKLNVQKEVIKQLKQDYDAQFEVRVINVSNQNLTIPEGEITYSVKSNTNQLRSKDIKRVEVYVDDKHVKAFIVPVEIKAYKSVLVASKLIERGQALNQSNTIIKKMNVVDNLDKVLTFEQLPKDLSAKKMFQEGELIDNRFVVIKPAVEQRTEVRAFFKNNEVMVSIDAFSLTSGMIGDYVTVQNQNNKKLYRAKVIGLNKVLINI